MFAGHICCLTEKVHGDRRAFERGNGDAVQRARDANSDAINEAMLCCNRCTEHDYVEQEIVNALT